MSNRAASMRVQSVLLVFLMVATLLAAPPPEIARAATRTVCSSGCDFTTISAAMSAASSGDVINVAPGNYVEQISLTLGTNATVSKTLTVTATGGADVTTITPPASGDLMVNVGGGNSGALGTLNLNGFTLTGGNRASGGAIWVSNIFGVLNLSNSIVTSNTSSSDGGGILNWGVVNITGSTISNNVAATTGGGVSNSGTMTVTDSVISGNTAAQGGGAYTETSSLGITHSLTVTRSTIDGNTASASGGGIGATGGTTAVTRSTISGNTASQGAGVWVTGESVRTNDVELWNSTVANNTGPGVQTSGAGTSPADVHLWYTTVAGNTGTGVQSGADGTITLARTLVATNGTTDCSGQIGMAAFNLIGVQGAGCTFQSAGSNDIIGTPGFAVDPVLGALTDNGGPTATFALLAGSPAIDAADTPAGCGFAVDQRGIVRPQGPACDIGAFELEGSGVGPLQTLINNAEAGGTVNVPAGTYNESVSIGEGKTLAGAGVGQTIIVGNGESSVVSVTGPATIQDVTVTGGGTGMDISALLAADVVLDRVQVRDNGSWGVSTGGQASVDILRSTIGPNNGGGVRAVTNHANGYGVEIVNSTISGNTGSGFYADAGSSVGPKYLIDHVTITDNPAGITVGSTANVEVYLRNSIVAGNVTNDCVAPVEKIISLGRNVIGDGTGCASWISTDLFGNADTIEGIPALDPMLGPLADNGGPTPTHALLAGSPAIDHAFKSAGFTSFDGTPKITTNGSAQLSSGRLRLTSGPDQAGTAFWQQPVLLDGNGFSTTFDFQISAPYTGFGDESSGDGLTFVIAPSPTSLGGGGGQIGIGSLADTVVVEFDTFSFQAEGFPNSDPNTGGTGVDHVGIDIDGNMQSSLLFDQFNGHFDDGAVWTATVTYDGSTLNVSVTNGTVTGSVSTDVDVAAVVGNGDPTAPAYFGFSSGTGAAGATHDILNWAGTIDGQCPATDQRGVTRPAGPACDSGAFEIDSIIPTALTVEIDQLATPAASSVIPIDQLNVGTFFGATPGPSSTQLGAIQLGAIQLGAIQLGAIGLADAAGHMTIGSIIDAANEIKAAAAPVLIPTILDTVTLVDVPIVGGWDEILSSTTLAGRPSYTVTLQQVIDTLDATGLDALRSTKIANSGVSASQLGAIQLGAIQLGAIQLGAIQLGAIQLGAIGSQLAALCAGSLDCLALGINPTDSTTYDGYSIMALTLMGVDLDFAQLGAIQLGAIDPSGTQLGAIQLGAIQLGAINLSTLMIGETQLGAIQLGAIQLGAIQLGAIGGAPGGTPALVAELCASGLDCAELGIDPSGPFTGDELDGYSLLALGAMGANLESTQLGAIQLGAIQLGAIGNLENTQLGAIQLGAIQLGAIAPADTQLGAIHLGAIQLGAIQLGAIDFNNPVFAQLGAIPLGTQLGAIQLGAIQLGAIQLGAIQLGAIANPSSIISCGSLAGGCAGNGLMTLAELDALGLILTTATLADLVGAMDDIPLSDLAGVGIDIVTLIGQATLLDLLPETTIAELPPDLTLGQLAELWVGMPLFELLLALLNPGELSWEDVDPAVLAAQHPAVTPWSVDFTMAGEPGLVGGAEFPFTAEVSVNLPSGMTYVPGSANLSVEGATETLLSDPEQNGATLQWIIDGLTLNSSRIITFDLGTAFTADSTIPVSTTVNTLGYSAFDAAPTIVLDVEPNDDFGTATDVAGDVVVLGRIGTETDVDMFHIFVPAGATIEAYLNPGGVDLDLVLFEPGQASDGELRGPAERIVDGSLDPTIGIDPVEQDQESLADIANTDIAPVFKASLHRSTGNEAIVTPPLREGGDFYLQVSGYNGATPESVYVSRIRVIDPPAATDCAPRVLANANAGAGSLPTDLTGVETLYLMNTQLFGNTFGAAATTSVLNAINGYVDASGTPIIGVNNSGFAPTGVVVPVEGDPAVATAYGAWLGGGNCSVDAANAVASAIGNLVDGYRGPGSSVKNIVIIGGDDQIPFFRVKDQGIVANEREYRSTFTSNNPLVASLGSGMVLTDAPYSDPNPLYVPQGDREVFIPQLPTGRLVDQPNEIVASLAQFVASNGKLDSAGTDPTAQVLGYDFLADSSATIAATLADQSFGVTSTVSETWDKIDLKTALDSASAIVNVNAHFDHTAALPAAGNLTNSFTNLYQLADLLPATSTAYAGTIIFSMGCHAGLNAADSYLVASDPVREWAQELLVRDAVFIGNTGFGYGDSDFSAYSEDLMALFAESIGTSNTIGEAFVAAQQTLAGKTAKWSPYHDKSQMEATLYGLPFYQLHETPLTTFPPNPTVATNSVGSLRSASVSTSAALSEEVTPDGNYLRADDVLAVPFRPVQPLEFIAVTPAESGFHATGAIIESGSSSDLLNFDVLYARPILYNELAEPETETTGAFPNALQAITSFETPSGRVDQLLLARGRYFPSTRTQQRWDEMNLTVYYAPDLDSLPPGTVVDVTPPTIGRVSAIEVAPSSVDFRVDAADASPGVLRVVVLYKASGQNLWRSVELDPVGGSWFKNVTGLTAAQNVDFFVQVLGGDGQVSVSTDKAEMHQVQPPGPPGIQVVSGTLGNNGIYKTPVAVALTGPANAPGAALEYSVDGGTFQTYGPAGTQIPVAEGTHTVRGRPVLSPTAIVTKTVVVDTTAPTVSVANPTDPAVKVELDSIVPLQYFCTDSGSGIAKCKGTVGNGQSLDTSTVGSHVAQVTATDKAGNTSSTPVPYTVVPERSLTLVSDQSLVAVGTSVGFTAEYTSTGVEDLHTIVWDFGDGVTATQVTTSVGTATISHPYADAGVYPVTVTVTHPAYPGHEEAYVQSETLRYIVVYDPADGFVTGGGWFDSPSGAYTPDDPEDPDIVGRAKFGFVSKYKKGANVPTGTTSFEFVAGNLDFSSTSYDWLVVTGNKAQYKGTGVVEGYEGDFKFRLTARDADIQNDDGFDKDGFRIQIWQTLPSGIDWVLYDNGLGADPATYGGTTELGGGSIVIHVPKGK